MKKLILACSAFAALCLTSCSPSKEDVKKEFVKACVDGGDKQMPNEQTKKIFRDYCECSGEKVADKFSVAELKDINKMQTGTPDPAKQQAVQTKLMSVIQPCLTDMQSKIMGAMGGARPVAHLLRACNYRIISSKNLGHVAIAAWLFYVGLNVGKYGMLARFSFPQEDLIFVNMETEELLNELENFEAGKVAGTTVKPFTLCSRLADYTTQLLKAKKLQDAASCFNRMAQTYINTRSAMLRSAIENVFLYRIGNFIFISKERPGYMALLPRALRDLLMRQMVPFGI